MPAQGKAFGRDNFCFIRNPESSDGKSIGCGSRHWGNSLVGKVLSCQA